MPTQRPCAPADQLAQIGGEIAAIVRRAWGRGPVKTTVRWAGADMLVVLLEDGHTVAEKTMLNAACTREFLAGRRLLHTLTEGDVRSCLEQVTGREVLTSLGATGVDPDLTAQVFVFRPDRRT